MKSSLKIKGVNSISVNFTILSSLVYLLSTIIIIDNRNTIINSHIESLCILLLSTRRMAAAYPVWRKSQIFLMLIDSYDTVRQCGTFIIVDSRYNELLVKK